MAEEIGGGDPEFLLGDPTAAARAGAEHQPQHRGLGLVAAQPSALDAMRRGNEGCDKMRRAFLKTGWWF
jgi:hypothetical protein